MKGRGCRSTSSGIVKLSRAQVRKAFSELQHGGLWYLYFVEHVKGD